MFFKASKAIHNSGKNCLERKFEQYMNEVIICARKNNDEGVVGKRVSMMASKTRREKLIEPHIIKSKYCIIKVLNLEILLYTY